MATISYLRDVVRTCQLGEILERVLVRTGASKSGQVLTYDIAKGSTLCRRMPGLFGKLKHPRLQYGYENGTQQNTLFAHIMDGEKVCKKIKYKNNQGTYNAEISGVNEHLSCIYTPDKPLLNLSASALRTNTGVKGTPENMLDFMLNLNDSALRVEGRVAKQRLGTTVNRFIPSKGRLSIASGVEGTPAGRTDIGLNYHGSDINLELQNAHLRKVGTLFSSSENKVSTG